MIPNLNDHVAQMQIFRSVNLLIIFDQKFRFFFNALINEINNKILIFDMLSERIIIKQVVRTTLWHSQNKLFLLFKV